MKIIGLNSILFFYFLLQDRAQEYTSASKTFKQSSHFKNWFLKPQNFEAFSYPGQWGKLQKYVP